MHSDLMLQLVFSIVIGIDQPCFSALLHERMRISYLIMFTSALWAACAPFMTLGTNTSLLIR